MGGSQLMILNNIAAKLRRNSYGHNWAVDSYRKLGKLRKHFHQAGDIVAWIDSIMKHLDIINLRRTQAALMAVILESDCQKLIKKDEVE